MTQSQTSQRLSTELTRTLTALYGPLVSSRELWRILGFANPAAYRQAIASRRIQLPLFEIEGRRGRFALTQEIAHWLVEQRSKIKEE